jgi:glutamate-ammonia-ligase adenylyltransferase
LLDPGFIPAHELLTRLLVTLRLVSPQSSEPPEPSRDVVARACGAEDWAGLVAAYDEARGLVGAEWRRVAGFA